MDGQKNINDVINGLDAALVQMHGCGRYTPEDVEELERRAWDALALLEAQEPRVMTLEEVQSCENAMWIELLGNNGFYAFVLDSMKNGILEISTRTAYLSYYSKDYNNNWRCWTSRPTDEVRKATPWN